MNKKILRAAPAVAAILALVLAVVALVGLQLQQDVIETQGVSNFDQVWARSSTSTVTEPILRARQDGAGDVLRLYDGSTVVFGVADGGGVTITGTLETTGAITQTGTLNVSDLVVQDDSTLGDAADDTTTINGDIFFTCISDTNASDYNECLKVEGDMEGDTTKDRHYGIVVELTRGASQGVAVGDHDEAGIKVRMNTKAITTTAGTTQRGMDVESKADNPSGTTTNLYGASITAKSDTGAGSVTNMIAATFNTQNNAAVTGNLFGIDVRLYRQAATVPTAEYGIQVRSSSSTGAGADAAIYLNSDYAGSPVTDSWDYGLDISGAAINTADIRLENGETISNQTDTVVALSGFLGLEEGAVIDLGAGGTITPNASYQPITNSTGGSIDTSAGTAIADGGDPGVILIICNEDAQSIVIKDGANTLIGGDKTLTGGAMDCMMFVWNGGDWQGLAFHDN